MRRYLRTLLLLLLFAAIFPFVYPWQDGRPLLSWSELRLPGLSSLQLPELPELAPPVVPGSGEARTPNEPVRLYRWQGSDGTTQFSNEPPAVGMKYEVVEVNPDANLVPATPLTPPAAPEAGSGESRPTPTLPSPLTVSPGEALQLLEDARALREQSYERLRQQEAVTR